ncbi:MAG: GspE/PulE family protein [Dissulfurispiraceae bacterium]
MDKTLLGQLLVKARLINEKQLQDALAIQKTEGKRLGSALLKLEAVSEESLITFLSRQYNVPPINLSDFKFDASVLKYIPYDMAKRYHLIPLGLAGGSLRVAIADPSNQFAVEDVKFITGMNISLYVAIESSILDAIDRYYPENEKAKGSSETNNTYKQEKVKIEESDLNLDVGLDEITTSDVTTEEEHKDLTVPVNKMLTGIIINAVKYRASDIHIEPGEEELRVRYRIDGVLKPVLKLPAPMKNIMAAKIKIMFHLDVSERRMPQIGRTKFRFGANKEIDCRVSTFPTLFGEKIVIRVLDKAHIPFDIIKLGFDQKQLLDFTEAIERPQGTVIISGPSESGKTTTIYSALLHLNKPGLNIMTAEDPIEFNLYGINQGQIKPDIGLTYVAAIESFLSQDPDIIMLGELKDHMTAELAVKAALTGRLVLSTLRANDAAGVLTRMVHMGIEPFAVSSAVLLAVAQRLVRTVCEHCKTPQEFDEETMLKIGFPSDVIGSVICYMGVGCPNCNSTGYSGRTAIYEVMPVQKELQDLVLRHVSAADLKQEAVLLGMTTLRQSGIRKVIEGITSVEEVLRVTFED